MKRDDAQAATLGLEARQVLENPAFNDAFERMSRAIFQAWRKCDLRDAEGQRLLLQQAKLVDRIKATLGGMIEQGNLADARIQADDLRDESRLRRGLRSVTGR
ncbi:hypothetical protein [Variovorax sp. JS1663]|uniref:hypothetical protein n=1 Tax=Variovorax sp. JS1663 TaxID=1851577 RepID=UPI000B343D2A|nr:hypothetical protein [Variovorax sp. JS1663]OUM01755.1 hypothetical protein A8M77_14430 [Variovorax sp. JS1663]